MLWIPYYKGMGHTIGVPELREVMCKSVQGSKLSDCDRVYNFKKSYKDLGNTKPPKQKGHC